MPNPSKFLLFGKSILFRSSRARPDSKSVSSVLFARGFHSSLRNEHRNIFMGFRKNGLHNSIPTSSGGVRAFYGGGDEIEMRKGDWNCPECNFHNFARNFRCLKCKTEGPKQVDVGNVEMKPGDWICPKCQYMNFCRNKTCKRCQEPSPGVEMEPGDWKCPACDYANFSRNTSCRWCNQEKPKEAECT